MKRFLTERFLWTLYNLYEAGEKFIEPFSLLSMLSTKRYRTLSDLKLEEDLKRIQRRKRFSKFIYYLKRQGYIEDLDLSGRKAILLTPKGKEKALRFSLKFLDDQGLKRREDKKWVMVIFDIPEKQRAKRDILRSVLYSLKFKQLQKSVWVSPFDVVSCLQGYIKALKLENYIKVFLIEEMTSEKF